MGSLEFVERNLVESRSLVDHYAYIGSKILIYMLPCILFPLFALGV